MVIVPQEDITKNQINYNMKQKIRKTGEVVEVITYSSSTRRLSTDIVHYIDSKGIKEKEYNSLRENKHGKKY